MNLAALSPVAADPTRLTSLGAGPSQLPTAREAFQEFVAGTFYQQMISELRSAEKPVPYLGGGRAEEVFRERLDAVLAEQFAASHGDVFVEDLLPAFEAEMARKAAL